MLVFLGNLPDVATELDLCIFTHLPPGTRTRIFRRSGGNGNEHCFGLICLDSERQGRELIRRMQGTSCHGQTLVVRTFGQRSAGNERRGTLRQARSGGGMERRRVERRLSRYAVQ